MEDSKVVVLGIAILLALGDCLNPNIDQRRSAKSHVDYALKLIEEVEVGVGDELDE